MESIEVSLTADGNVKWYHHSRKVAQLLQELNTDLLSHPAILVLAITQEKCKHISMKTLVHEC